MDTLAASLLNRTFDLPEVAEAFGIPVQTVHTWRRRGYLVGHRGGGERGRKLELSFFNAMEVGIGHAALVAGIPEVGFAFTLATRFGHGGPFSDVAGQRRKPGLTHHYSHGRTLLHYAAAAKADCESLSVETYDDVTARLGSPHFLTVSASDVFSTFCRALGIDPAQVLDEAYRDED